MKLISRLEHKLGRFAIPHLTMWVVLFNAIGYVLAWRSPDVAEMLFLDPAKVMQGEVWRLVTYLFIPPSFSPLLIAFVLYFFYMMGEALEHEWGAFRLNLYYLIGMVATTVIAFF